MQFIGKMVCVFTNDVVAIEKGAFGLPLTIGYLMPNPVYTYKNMISKWIIFW